MKRLVLTVVGLLALLLGAPVSRALTTIDRDFDQLVERADAVFKGTVVSKNSLWVGAGEERHIATRVTFKVGESYKGNTPAQETLEFVGGTVDGVTLVVPDTPQFEVGQVAVLFVVGKDTQFCPLVGIKQGRFHVVKDAASGRERVFTDDHIPVVDTAEIGKVDDAGVPRLRRYVNTNAQAMAADDFKTEILGRVAARAR